MRCITKGLAASLAAVLLCGLFAACGKEDGEETFSAPLHKPSEKSIHELSDVSFNQFEFVEEGTDTRPSGSAEDAGFLIQVDESVAAGAEMVPFRIVVTGDVDFTYGYEDILLQKKTAEGWQTYRRIDAVPAIGMLIHAGGASNERVKPAEYGVELRSGETYRILFGVLPTVYGEFRVE